MDFPTPGVTVGCTPLKQFGDPDLTGWGVISAFTISFIMTYVSVLLAYFLRALPPERYTRFDDVIIRSISCPFRDIFRSNDKDEENSNPDAAADHIIPMDTLNVAPESPIPPPRSISKTRIPSVEQFSQPCTLPETSNLTSTAASSVHSPNESPRVPFQARRATWFTIAEAKRIASFEAFLLTMSDQQLVTGFAIVLVTTIMRKISQMPLHVQNIATYLGYFSCIIHLCTLTFIRNYFHRHRRLLHLRVFFMITILILLLYNIWGVVPHGYYSSAECIIVPSTHITFAPVALSLILIMGYLQRFIEIYIRARPSATSSWLLLLAFKMCPQLEEAYIRRMHSRVIIKVPDQTFKPLVFFVITATKGLQASLFLEIIWLSGYFTLGMAYIMSVISWNSAIIQASPGFGQFVPLFLLALPIISAFEIHSGVKSVLPHAQGVDTHAEFMEAPFNIDTQVHSIELPATGNHGAVHCMAARSNAIDYLFEKFGQETKIYSVISAFILFVLTVFWGMCFGGAVNVKSEIIAQFIGIGVEAMSLLMPLVWNLLLWIQPKELSRQVQPPR